RRLTFIWRRMRCRRSRADISADAELSASRLAGDAELPHFGLKGRPFHVEAGSGAGWTSDYPMGLSEDAQDVLALGCFQRRDFVGSGDGWRFQFPERNTQVRPRGEDHGPLDQIFELADVTGPVVLGERGHGIRWDCGDRPVHA